MILLPGGDPACWGMDGLPLLPPDWRFGVIGSGLVMEIETAGRTEPKPILSESLNGSWAKPGAIWKAIPAEAAQNVVEQFLADPKNHRWLDHPILSAPPRNLDSVLNIPYLNHTQNLLTELGLLNHDLGWVLTSSSALELWQTIGDITALLDLIITSRNWIRQGSTATAVIATRENVFDLAAERFLAMAGVPTLSRGRGLEDDAFREALGGRAGLHPSGQLTLEEAGQRLDITRERLRQIANRYDFDHEFHRAWPDNGMMNTLLTEWDIGSTETKILVRLSNEYRIDEPVKAKLDELSLLNTQPKLLQNTTRACWQLSEGSGFFRIPDAIELLGTLHGLDERQARLLINDIALFTGLPHDTAFVKHGRDPWILETSHTILGQLGQASITKLHLGLARRYAGRKSERPGAGPPAIDILLAFLTAHPDFEVDGHQVTTLTPKTLDDSTVQAWILRRIREAGGVAHSSVLYELARQDGINRSSVHVTLNVVGYLIEPVGYGCFVRLGDPYSPTDISIARSTAKSISIPTSAAQWSIDHQGIDFQCVIGTHLINTGVLHIPKRAQRLIGDQRIVVQSSTGTHGHIALSQSNLYGLNSVFQALDAAPGDTLHLSISIPSQEATVAISHE